MKKLFILSLFFIFFITLVSAAPPIQTNVNIDLGYSVELAVPDTLKINESFKFHAHVWNRSDGTPITNDGATYCTLHVYTPTGSHIVESNMTADSGNIHDWNYSLGEGNLKDVGLHPILVFCQDDMYGGFSRYEVMVTQSGNESTFGLQIFLYIFLFGLVILGFFVRNEWVVILGGIGLIMLGIFSLTQGISDFRNQLTELISIVTIAFGAMVSVGTAVRMIEDGL